MIEEEDLPEENQGTTQTATKTVFVGNQVVGPKMMLILVLDLARHPPTLALHTLQRVVKNALLDAGIKQIQEVDVEMEGIESLCRHLHQDDRNIDVMREGRLSLWTSLFKFEVIMPQI